LARAVLQRLLLFPLLDWLCRVRRVEGLEQLTGLQPPFLLVANHSSHLDTLLILRCLPTALRARLAVAAAADYFFARGPLSGLVSLLANAFPLTRRGPARASLTYCAELAAAGWAILLYPEGTRSVDGQLRRFKPGIGLLATTLELPVVPVSLTGTHTCLPRGARRLQPAAITVRFGAPQRFVPGTPAKEVTAQVEAVVCQLLEQTG
jgi:long-chain acyl-CoA synthetase